MNIISLRDATTNSSARIAPSLGFNCFEFRADVDGEIVDVIDAAPEFAAGNERPSGHGIPILFPFPSRIQRGRYEWDGREYELPPDVVGYDATGNAIHGFCLDRPWRVTAVGDHFVVGEFQLSVDAPERLAYWPADCLIEIRYELRGPNLRADFRIANPDDKPLPWGLGTHAYFRVPLGDAGKAGRCLVEVPASQQWELQELLPTGKRIAVAGAKDLREGTRLEQLQLDDVYTDLAAGEDSLDCLILDEESGLQMLQRCDPMFREIVAYTPPGRDAVCLEPYTCIPDAINLQQQGVDAGWRVLEPGGEFRTWVEFRVGRVLA
jgi:aldose 1-epimerase